MDIGIIANTKLKRRTSDHDVYAALLRTIIYQQLSGKAANTIHLRFLDLFSQGYPHAEECDLFARYVLPELNHAPLYPAPGGALT